MDNLEVKNSMDMTVRKKEISDAVELNIRKEFLDIVSEILLQYHGSSK